MSKFSKKQSKNTWKKYLAQAITAGLLTGMYNTAGFAAAPLLQMLLPVIKSRYCL